MLHTNVSNLVTFNVNVFGTQSKPDVRFVFGSAPGLIFPANKLEDGRYEAKIDLPPLTELGLSPYKIEVLVNGRLFTPIQSTIMVTAGEEPAHQESVEAQEPVEETVAPEESAPSIELVSTEAEPEVKEAKPMFLIQDLAAQEGKYRAPKSILQDITKTAGKKTKVKLDLPPPPEMKLASVAKVPESKPVKLDLPPAPEMKLSTVAREPVKIELPPAPGLKLAEFAKEAPKPLAPREPIKIELPPAPEMKLAALAHDEPETVGIEAVGPVLESPAPSSSEPVRYKIDMASIAETAEKIGSTRVHKETREPNDLPTTVTLIKGDIVYL